jgi:hypothetical protein
MNPVEILTIPYAEQRYPTCGDYWHDIHGTHYRINDMGNEDYEFLVSIHEQIEQHLTKRRGLTEPEIMAFDVMWEKEREAGQHEENEEPGHDTRAPYHKEHVLAETIERLLAVEMGISWPKYEFSVNASCR